MEMDWKNKVVFLNIAVVPVGAAIVENLLKQGVKHTTIFDTNEEAGTSLQDKLNKKYSGDRFQFIKGDVSIEDQLERSMRDIIAVHGYIDVVLNHALMINEGQGRKEVFTKMINVNFTSLITSTLMSFELMKKENGGKGGTVINITSCIALTPCYPLPIYTAVKEAILKFSHLIGKPEYFSKTGVRIFTLVLGAYDTPLLHSDKFQTYDKVMEAEFFAAVSKLPVQKAEIVAQAIMDVYKKARGGSTWMFITHLEDITSTINKSFEVANVVHLFE